MHAAHVMNFSVRVDCTTALRVIVNLGFIVLSSPLFLAIREIARLSSYGTSHVWAMEMASFSEHSQNTVYAAECTMVTM